MTWKNHKFATLAVVYAGTGSLAASFIAATSSLLPDLLELRGVVPHRTVTHYPYPFILAAGVFWYLLSVDPGYAYYAAFFASVGVLLHIVQDGLSVGGVPLVTPGGRRIGAKLYVTRAPSEWMVVVYILGGCLLVAAARGFLSPAYLQYSAVLAAEMGLNFVKTVGGSLP